MISETGEISPETNQKYVTLSELMIDRNNLIEILGGIQRKGSTISAKTKEVLINKYRSKIDLIDKQMVRVASGLNCSICQKVISLSDDVLVCQWCGSPAHTDPFLKHIKSEGYCPACGEYLKFHYRGAQKTITQDLFKTCVFAFSDKIHEVKVFYKKKLIDREESGDGLICPECKKGIQQNWKFCKSCGVRLERKATKEVHMTICPRCGRQIKSSWRFCKLCGHPL